MTPTLMTGVTLELLRVILIIAVLSPISDQLLDHSLASPMMNRYLASELTTKTSVFDHYHHDFP